VIQIGVIVGSTRPGRKAESVARWVVELARKRGDAEIERVDLADYELPLLDEPSPPSLGPYTKEHTKRWAATIDRLDAFVFVTPEYNFSLPPSLLNAIDFLHREWAYKPAGFVSYGGVSGGTRAVQMAKQTLTGVKVMPMAEGVAIPFVDGHIENGEFKSTDRLDHSTKVLLDELHRWAVALRPMRG
jgi:NAD(P)H-dependent FMN reductase